MSEAGEFLLTNPGSPMSPWFKQIQQQRQGQAPAPAAAPKSAIPDLAEEEEKKRLNRAKIASSGIFTTTAYSGYSDRTLGGGNSLSAN